MAQHLDGVVISPVTLGKVELGGVGQVQGKILALLGIIFILLRHAEGDLQGPSRADGLAPLLDHPASAARGREQEHTDQHRAHRMAPGVPPGPIHDGRWSGEDWLALPPAVQIVSEVAGREIALRRLFLQAFQADRLQVEVGLRIECAGSARFFMNDLLDRLLNRSIITSSSHNDLRTSPSTPST
jgi:hypothetical protein